MSLWLGCRGTIAAWKLKQTDTVVATCDARRDGHDPHVEIRKVPDLGLVIKMIMQN